MVSAQNLRIETARDTYLISTKIDREDAPFDLFSEQIRGTNRPVKWPTHWHRFKFPLDTHLPSFWQGFG